jgi:hypothetical protein
MIVMGQDLVRSGGLGLFVVILKRLVYKNDEGGFELIISYFYMGFWFQLLCIFVCAIFIYLRRLGTYTMGRIHMK